MCKGHKTFGTSIFLLFLPFLLFVWNYVMFRLSTVSLSSPVCTRLVNVKISCTSHRIKFRVLLLARAKHPVSYTCLIKGMTFRVPIFFSPHIVPHQNTVCLHCKDRSIACMCLGLYVQHFFGPTVTKIRMCQQN
jgi:hypothetical protein